ncbi:Uncharacterised protein [Amycolatopsis camponoti]|uniref:Uncharacterized protein n=1 Tax=Amycolatopsis camponoti TaxID=2606593 RepID=A0A6I8LP58_9PSEU|nr:Uncharacterised protein [Amycolatopsis camponoti]
MKAASRVPVSLETAIAGATPTRLSTVPALSAAYPSAGKAGTDVHAATVGTTAALDPGPPPGAPEEGHPGGVGFPRDGPLLARRTLGARHARRAGGRLLFWGSGWRSPCFTVVVRGFRVAEPPARGGASVVTVGGRSPHRPAAEGMW